MRIAEAVPADITAIRGMLAEAGLPFDDLKASGKARFLLAHADAGMVVGAIGLEIYGQSGLLRSLVVKTNARSRGLGVQLTLNLERLANSLGVETLYLLTTTAEKFFATHGYQRFERKQVPPAIAATAEFRFLCSSTAVCMCKQLGE